MDELPRFLLGGTASGLILGFPIVLWLVPSPEFQEFVLVGHVLGGLLGGVAQGYLGKKTFRKTSTRFGLPLLWGVLAVACWTIYKFGWREEKIDSLALVGMATLLFAALISFGAAFVVLMIYDKRQSKR